MGPNAGVLLVKACRVQAFTSVSCAVLRHSAAARLVDCSTSCGDGRTEVDKPPRVGEGRGRSGLVRLLEVQVFIACADMQRLVSFSKPLMWRLRHDLMKVFVLR